MRSFGWGAAPNWSNEAGVGCLEQTVRWGALPTAQPPAPGNNFRLSLALRPCRLREVTGVDGGVCTHPLIPDAGVDVDSITAALKHPDVLNALAMDGGVLGSAPQGMVTRIAVENDGGARHIDVAQPCDAGTDIACVPAAPGVLLLRDLLDALHKQQEAVSDCKGSSYAR